MSMRSRKSLLTAVATVLLLSLLSSTAPAQHRPGLEPNDRNDAPQAARSKETERTSLVVEAIEGPTDTVSFHIGSPLFLRLRIPQGNSACTPFNGQPFFFDAGGAQLGWRFEEITDTLLFPNVSGDCERILMLSSENSNLLPEGYFTLQVAILFDAATRMSSNVITVHPKHSPQGADTLSYTRFLQEQIVGANPLLHDPETLKALFAEGVPKSPESEIFRALILYRVGDLTGAETAIESSDSMIERRRAPLTVAAAATRNAILAAIREAPTAR